MRRIAAAALVLVAGWLAFAEEPDLDTRARIEGYVKLLAADDAKTRDDAEKALLALGDVVRPFLAKAMSDASGEVRSRSRTILARLDDLARGRTGEDQTWPGLRGGSSRSGIRAGELPVAKPSLVWSQDVDAQPLLQGAVVPAGEYVACIAGNGVVRAYAAADGRRLWLAELPALAGASAVLAANRLVVPTGKGLVALDVRDGREAWRVDAKYGCNAAPAVVGRRVYAAFRNLGVKAFDIELGTEVFDKSLAPAGALLADGDLVVCGTEDGDLVRLDAESGRERWRRRLGAAPNMGPTLAAPGVVAVFTKDRFLRAFRAEDGRELWQERVAAVSGSESLAAAAGRVFLSDTAGWMNAFDAATGRSLWRRNEGLTQMGGPCATQSAVLCSARGRMTCRDADSGDFLWRIDCDARDSAAPAVAGGRIFVLYDGSLRCYR